MGAPPLCPEETQVQLCVPLSPSSFFSLSRHLYLSLFHCLVVAPSSSLGTSWELNVAQRVPARADTQPAEADGGGGSGGLMGWFGGGKSKGQAAPRDSVVKLPQVPEMMRRPAEAPTDRERIETEIISKISPFPPLTLHFLVLLVPFVVARALEVSPFRWLFVVQSRSSSHTSTSCAKTSWTWFPKPSCTFSSATLKVFGPSLWANKVFSVGAAVLTRLFHPRRKSSKRVGISIIQRQFNGYAAALVFEYLASAWRLLTLKRLLFVPPPQVR